MDDLLDKQSRELQDLGEATPGQRAVGWGQSPTALWIQPQSINSLPLSPGAHCGFYSCVFTHSLNTG